MKHYTIGDLERIVEEAKELRPEEYQDIRVLFKKGDELVIDRLNLIKEKTVKKLEKQYEKTRKQSILNEIQAILNETTVEDIEEERLFNYLLENWEITNYRAEHELGISNAYDVVYRLRNKGEDIRMFQINTTWANAGYYLANTKYDTKIKGKWKGDDND